MRAWKLKVFFFKSPPDFSFKSECTVANLPTGISHNVLPDGRNVLDNENIILKNKAPSFN